MPSQIINPDNPFFHYTGRIDFREPSAPAFAYAGSYITAQFTGSSVQAVFDDLGDWWSKKGNKLGFIVDGGDMLETTLEKGQLGQIKPIATGLEDAPHTLVIAKLSGPGAGSNTLVFRGLILDEGKTLTRPISQPTRRIEVYGDSVTEGEGAGCPEGTHDCGNNNGWLSYANVLARLLGAEIHNLGIGGLAVRSETGYYNNAHTGLENTFNCVKPYNDFPAWDFSRYTPHLVIMAMGVNDASTGALTDLPAWKDTYKGIVRAIMRQHNAQVPILFTAAAIETAADQAYPCLKQVADELRAEGLQTDLCCFSFRVSGHPNRVESEAMARELYEFIQNRRLLR